jgi:hypothetical protein
MGVLVVQTLENKPTASPGWDPFGDVISKRTPMTSEKGKDISPEKSNSPLLGVEGLRCLQSLLGAPVYCTGQSSNIYMVARVIPKSCANINYLQVWWWILAPRSRFKSLII